MNKGFMRTFFCATLAGAMFLYSPNAEAASPCQKSIDDLKAAYVNNPQFTRLVTSAFENMKPRPPEYGGGNPWIGKGFPDLVDFLTEWCVFLPTAVGSGDTGLDYIGKFAWFY